MQKTVESSLILTTSASIMENPDNPRFIKDRKFDQLVDSIMEFPEMLYKRPLVAVTVEGGKFMVLGGNMRLKGIPAAIRRLKKAITENRDEDKTAGLTKKLDTLQAGIPLLLADEWTQAERDEFVIKDNVSYGEHDWELLANRWDADTLLHWGLDIPQIDVIPDPEDDDFDMPLPEEPITQPGDIYEMGEHRLICGDCTDLVTVELLLLDKKAHLSFTSPPYWVGKAYETQRNEQEIDDFIENVAVAIIHATSSDLGRIVINTGTSSINRIDKKRKVEILPLIDKWGKYFRRDGWLMRHLRIWVKRGQLPAIIAPKSDVIDQHNEYIATWENEWSQILTFWEPDGNQRGQQRLGTKWAQQGVWDDVHGEKSAEGRHIAAFPVEIPFRNILLYTTKGEIVFDPFGGSGTTMIAAEQLGRKSVMIELSPAYCDVIVTRYAEWMKQKGMSVTIKKNGIVISPLEPKPNE